MSINAVGSRQSWSFSHKDVDDDQKISFAEYMAPVPEGESVLQPADLAHAPSLKDMFSSFDRNHDGFVTSAELGGQVTGRAAQQSTKLVDDVKAAAQAIASYVKLGPAADISSKFAAVA